MEQDRWEKGREPGAAWVAAKAAGKDEWAAPRQDLAEIASA
jgi:hypothetical protein